MSSLNPVESHANNMALLTSFAINSTTLMIWKLLCVAEKNFRLLNGYWLLPDVYSGKRFVDGVMVEDEKVNQRRRVA